MDGDQNDPKKNPFEQKTPSRQKVRRVKVRRSGDERFVFVSDIPSDTDSTGEPSIFELFARIIVVGIMLVLLPWIMGYVFSFTPFKSSTLQIAVDNLESKTKTFDKAHAELLNKAAALETQLAAIKTQMDAQTGKSVPASEIAQELVKNEAFHAELVRAVGEAPTKGLATQAELKTFATEEANKWTSFQKDLDELSGVYDAINIDNKENVMAVPIIRKDIERLTSDFKAAKEESEKRISALQTATATDVSRLYGFATWTIGPLLAIVLWPTLSERFSRWNTKKAVKAAAKAEHEADDAAESAELAQEAAAQAAADANPRPDETPSEKKIPT